MNVTLTVNGVRHSVDVPPDTLLVDLLRTHLELTGTHVGCDTSQCGACTVLKDNVSVKACTLLAAQADGAAITTIEGIGLIDALHPMQAAFRECHALQCGFCTPGMILAAVDLVQSANRNGEPLDENRVRKGLDGNFCRCTGYHNIVRAVLTAAEQMDGAP